MQRISSAVEAVRRETDDQYVLAQPILFTDTIDIYIQRGGDLYRAQDGQRPIKGVIETYLRRVTIDESDGFPSAFMVPLTASGVVCTVDPRFNAGRLSLPNRVPVFSVLGALEAGQSKYLVAEDFGIPIEQVEAVEHDRVFLKEVA